MLQHSSWIMKKPGEKREKIKYIKPFISKYNWDGINYP